MDSDQPVSGQEPDGDPDAISRAETSAESIHAFKSAMSEFEFAADQR
jgi:hypothetical protein